MKLALLICLFSITAAHAVEVGVPFDKIKRRLFVDVENTGCGKKPFVRVPHEPSSHFKLVCQDGYFKSEIPMDLLKNIPIAEIITSDMKESAYFTHDQIKAVITKPQTFPWGRVYKWSTPNFGSNLISYVCPNGGLPCIKVQSGALEVPIFRMEEIK
jgi:hypothetical protein